MRDADRDLLERIQDGIPLTGRPFRDIGRDLGMGEGEVLERLKSLQEEGVIRRFGARVNHHRIGLTANALVCWEVPEGLVEAAGRTFAAHPAVTHCYERVTVPGTWDFNLYTVLHSSSPAEIDRILRELSAGTGISRYVVLSSLKKFKHTMAARIPPREGLR